MQNSRDAWREETRRRKEEAAYEKAMAAEKAKELAEEKKAQAKEEVLYNRGMAQEKRQELAEEKAYKREAYLADRRAEKEQAKEEAAWEKQRGKEVQAIKGTGTRVLKGGAGMAVSVLKGLGKLAFKKGVRHPDSIIDPKAKFLYLPSNPQATPLGHFMENPMELYFGSRRTRSVPPSARTVLSALQQGFSPEQLEVITGLSSQEINQSLRYLVDKKLINREDLE